MKSPSVEGGFARKDPLPLPVGLNYRFTSSSCGLQVFVTPKYLSSISKETCGKIASEVITYYVKRDIEYLLKCPNKSIKEIVNELNFASLSFFGKYVKRNFGVSPKEFRENLIKTAAVV